MKLIKQIIEKKLNYFEEHFLNRRYFRAIWDFYCAYNLALALLKIAIDKKEEIKRNSMWTYLLTTKKTNYILDIFQKVINQDRQIILRALDLLDEMEKDKEKGMGDYYKKGSVAIASYEFPYD